MSEALAQLRPAPSPTQSRLRWYACVGGEMVSVPFVVAMDDWCSTRGVGQDAQPLGQAAQRGLRVQGVA